MKQNYIQIDSKIPRLSRYEKFEQVIKRTFSKDLFVGLWIVLKQMLFFKCHTLDYPKEKFELSSRYRALHKLLRLLGSGNSRCISCGLCEQICISDCIRIESNKDENGRKQSIKYDINLGRCIYCGFCAEVCPELAIVHGNDYENSSEQRAHFTEQDQLLTPLDEFLQGKQQEFTGYGSLSVDANDKIKKTPLKY